MNKIQFCAIRKQVLTAGLLLLIMSVSAQIRINTGDNSPLRKLQYAELAITNLYVDSVDERKLVEDAIKGMLDKLDPTPAIRHLRR